MACPGPTWPSQLQWQRPAESQRRSAHHPGQSWPHLVSHCRTALLRAGGPGQCPDLGGVQRQRGLWAIRLSVHLGRWGSPGTGQSSPGDRVTGHSSGVLAASPIGRAIPVRHVSSEGCEEVNRATHAGEPGEDGAELGQGSSSVQGAGVVHDRFEPEHVFALGVAFQRQESEVDFEDGEVPAGFLHYHRPAGGQARAGPAWSGPDSEQCSQCGQVEPERVRSTIASNSRSMARPESKMRFREYSTW